MLFTPYLWYIMCTNSTCNISIHICWNFNVGAMARTMVPDCSFAVLSSMHPSSASPAAFSPYPHLASPSSVQLFVPVPLSSSLQPLSRPCLCSCSSQTYALVSLCLPVLDGYGKQEDILPHGYVQCEVLKTYTGSRGETIWNHSNTI